MGKQKQKIDMLERRIREVEASNKVYCSMLKDLLDRLIKSETEQTKKDLARGLEECLNEDKKGDEKVKVSFCTEGCSEKKKQKEGKHGV